MEQAGTVSAKCPHCGQTVLGPAQDLRQTVRCPRCQRVLVMADIVSLDTPIAAATVSGVETSRAAPAPAPPRRPLPAKTIRMQNPANAEGDPAPTVAAPTIESILGSLEAKPQEPAADAMGFTAPMSSPPKSAVTPLPAQPEATVAVLDILMPPPAPEPAPETDTSATLLAVGVEPVAPGPAPAAPAAPVGLATKPQPDVLLARFELIDRYTRPHRAWILLGLCAAVTIAETFDSIVGSFPIFRTLAAAFAWVGSFVLLAARIAGAHEDDEPWSLRSAIGELRAAGEAAIEDVRQIQSANATQVKRLAGRAFFLLGLVAFALWSIVDGVRLVLSEILHVAMRAKPDLSGHATVVPFVVLAAGGVVLYLVARDERSGELRASKEVLAQALPLHATPVSTAQLIEQARLFPPAFHPVLASLATSVSTPFATERLTAQGVRSIMRRSLNRIEVVSDVPASGHEATSRRVQLAVGRGVFVDLTFVRSEADIERAANRARTLADEKRGGLLVVVAKGSSELRDLLTPKVAELRQKTPVVGVWVESR